ncbi:zinc finger MYM-type protein 1-like [Camellia sinensis]|uniref:zinc finger MYM-type protein 1-like n=1 Tax=Camellia sinensis TaxID=4442 RepID=UPI001036DE80|nr:zinc finger MYM-type protein 1-like [Camellia sinensis]
MDKWLEGVLTSGHTNPFNSEVDFSIKIDTIFISGGRSSCLNRFSRLAFHGHDESKNSSNQGNFLELLKFLADHNEDVKVVTLSNAPQNIKLTSPDIQKDIVNVAAFKTINVIIRGLGDALFSILIDEAGDISIKEQMAVVIRYVDKKGQVIERFLGTEHVVNMNALSLKQAMENLFSRLGLSISKLRGQGYDGASNMQAMAKNHNQIALLFTLVSNVVNVVGASCKHRDIIREKQAAKVAEALNTGELSSGQGLNQETNLKRAGDTRWGSHYGTLVSLASMFSTVIDVLEMILEDDVKVVTLSNAPQNIKLTSPDIQKDIVNVAAFETINVIIRDLGDALFSILIDEAGDISIKEQMAVVIRYVDKKGQVIERFLGTEHVVNTNALSLKQAMENLFSRLGLSISRLRGQGYDGASNMQAMAKNHNQIALLFTLVSNVVNVVGASCKHRDIIREKQAAKVAEALNTGELSSGQCLNQETNLKRAVELMVLNDQLNTYIIDILSSSEFSILNGIVDLTKKMVETRKDKVHPLVYLLLTLALILTIATVIVERVFSAMNIVKNRLRNRMSDKWMYDSLVVYIERDIFDSIEMILLWKDFKR